MSNPLIVLTFEGFSPAALSCYGSSWNQTPLIDSIAGNGSVWDRCLATTDDPNESLRAIVRQLLSSEQSEDGSVELLTDVPSMADGKVDPFFDRIDVFKSDPRTEPASDVIDSQLGQLFAAAIQRDADEMPWRTLWIHSGFLTSQWDAPRDADASDVDSTDFALEEETNDGASGPPLVFDSVDPPRFELTGDEHPDLITSWMRTYGSQIRMIDLLSEMLLGSIDHRRAQVVIAGVSGFRFGQAGWIGHRCGPLRSRDVHVPMIQSGNAPVRHTPMTSTELAARMIVRSDIEDPADLATLPGRELQLSIESNRSQSNRFTDDWFFVRDQDSTEHLYSKPDDIDDFNDVARVRPDVVDQLDN